MSNVPGDYDPSAPPPDSPPSDEAFADATFADEPPSDEYPPDEYSPDEYPPDESSSGAGLNRRRALGVVAAIAVLAASVGWIAGQRIKSPAAAAADAEAPDASLITVPVELRVLSSNVVTRGDITFSEESELSVQGSSVDGTAIITRLPKAVGDELAEGEVFVEVSGRPVMVLEGELPVFRNFAPGLVGPDVRQLEEALVRLGFDPGAVDDNYDAATEAAVGALYEQLGYPAVGPSREEQESLTAARNRVLSAQQSVAGAQAELNSASGGLPESQRLQYEASIAEAEAALAEARAAADGTGTEEYEAVQEAEAELADAQEALQLAQERLALAEAGTDPDADPDVDPPEPVTEARLEELRAEVALAQERVNLATGLAEAARAGLATVQAQGSAAVESAQLTLEIAQATYREATQGNDVSAFRQAVQSAQAELTAAQGDLATLEAEVGTSLPASELVFLPSLPRVVQRVAVNVGDTPTGTIMTVTGAGVQVESAIGAEDRRLIELGAAARLTEDGLGLDVGATVSFIADEGGTEGLPADRYRLRLSPDAELPEDAYFSNVRVTIPVESTGGEVLAVPLAAVSANSDGSARVEVERSPGETELVTVATGLSSGGYVAVEPIDGELSAGDRVVVGTDRQSSGDEDDGDEDGGDEGNEDEGE